MKRLIQLAARLYPSEWRARYDKEFEALIEDSHAGVREFLDVILGAMKMQIMRGSYWKFAAVAATAGFLVAGAIVLRMPWRYVATTDLRTTAPDTELRVQNVLTRGSLSEVINRPSLRLYPEERRRIPMEKVIDLMRSNLQVRSVGNEVRISFSYPDKEKAKATVAAITNKLIEGNAGFRPRQAAWPEVIWQPLPAGEAIQVLSGGSVPPAGRMALVLAGTMLGLLIGVISAVVLRHGKAARRVSAFTLAGGVVAAALALLLPDTYVSTAVLRITPALVPGETDQTFRPQERLATLQREVLSRDELVALIQRPSLDLYRKERAGHSMDEVLELMRRDLSIRTPVPGLFMISFEYSDRFKAQAVVRELVTKFTERNLDLAAERNMNLPPGTPERLVQIYKASSTLEVLDRASDPQTPSSPNRSQIAFFGLFLGALLAALTRAWQRWRSTRLRVA